MSFIERLYSLQAPLKQKGMFGASKWVIYEKYISTTVMEEKLTFLGAKRRGRKVTSILQ